MSIPFRCPLCSSTVYEQIVVKLPSGRQHQSSLYRCAGCSVVFQDKDAFTRRAKYRQGPMGLVPKAERD